MKKESVLFILCIINAITAVWAGNTVTIDGKEYRKEILVQPHQVAPGIKHYAYRLPDRPLEVFLLEVDLTNPYVSMEVRLAHDSIGKYQQGGTKETVKAISVRNSRPKHQVIGAVNGDFFNVHELKNGCIQDGVYANSPSNFGPLIGFAGNTPYIDEMIFQGSINWNRRTYDINSTNGDRNADEMVLYTSLNGRTTKTNNYGREVVLKVLEEVKWDANVTVKCEVKENSTKGSHAIGENELVLSGHGIAAGKLENMNVGDKLTLKLALALKGTPQVFPDFTSLVGSNIQFLKEGQACDFTSTAGSPTGLAPRTCVGYSKDKQTLYICMVDGYPTSEYRLPDYPSDSKGTTVADLANIMKDAGAYTAMNFDGGGSSYMYLKPKKGPANKPSENGANGGRAVRNALTACSIAPEDSKAVSLKLSTDAIYLEPGQTLKLIASTYNQYGTVIDYNLNTGVTYRSTGSIGTIVNGTLTATSAPQSGKIEATYNGMKASTSIYVGIPIPTEIKTVDVESPVYVTFSNGTISVSLPAEEIEMLTIYAITGQSSCKVKGTNRIEVGHLQSGIYLCEILKANGTKQVVKLALTK